MSEAIEIEVQLFAAAAEQAGCRSTLLAIPSGGTVADCVRLLLLDFPQLEPLAKHCRWAIGTEFTDLDQRLYEPECIAMIPPVSGG
jgi:molybdopterin converting factor small subunit